MRQFSAIVAGFAALVLAFTAPAHAVDTPFQIVQSQTSISLDTGLTPEPVTVSATGSAIVDVDPTDPPAVTAGVSTLTGLIADPVYDVVDLSGLIITFDIPANTVQFTVTANGSTDNPVTAETFSQADVTFAFTGTIGGSLSDGGSTNIPFTTDLAAATVTAGEELAGATITGSGGIWTLTLPLNLELEVPLELMGYGTLPLGLAITGQVVLETPEPAALALLGLGGVALLGRRSRIG